MTRLRGGAAPWILYPLLALLTFPTLETIIGGDRGLGYVLDVFDLPRTGVLGDWLANGPTLWNTHLTAGNALLAQQALSPYALDVLLAFVIGPFGAYVVVAWLMAAIAGMSMHLFLRDSMRLPTFAVVGGATVYLFGFWHYSYGFAALAPPLLLWLIDRAVVAGPRRWRFILGGALVGAYLLYHGLSQVVLIAAALQLAYVVATAPAGRADRRERVAIWVATWGLALGLYGPVLLSQAVMLPISQRTIWDLRALYDPRPLEAIRDTLQHYSAVLFGAPIATGVGGSPGRYGTYFLGALGLPLLVLGLDAARRGGRARFIAVLLVAIPIVDLVAVLATPLQDQLGFLKSFQFVRVRHLFPFALAATAAIGLQVVAVTLRSGRPLLARGRWRLIAVIASCLPVLATLVVGIRQLFVRRRDLLAFDTAALGWLLVVAAIVIGGATLVWLGRRAGRATGGGPRRGVAVLVVLLVLIGAERAAYQHAERFIRSGDLGTWADHLAVTPAQAFLLDQPGIDVDRVLKFGDDSNRMGAVGLLQADGYQSLFPLTYHRVFGALIDPQLALDPTIETYYRQWGNRAVTFGPRVDPEIVALTGVRWLVVRGADRPTVPGAVERFRDGDETVYELSDTIPRAFVAGGLDVLPDAEAVIDRLSAASLDEIRAMAFVAAGPDADVLTDATGVGAPAGSEAPSAGTATILAYTPDRVEIAVHAGAPGVLVLTDVMAPGWVAERDGTTVPIATVDGAFRGVAVDPSTDRVVFRYAPWFTAAGFGLAAASLAGAVAWALAVRRRDRRRADR